ncbi:MAG TPA: LysM peptidoglycan-binding domain-containing protein [Bacteroidetes bacterium]|nr:LysM peptidoglycan-binding domain-containing protein [Bacteroidota bacterium]
MMKYIGKSSLAIVIGVLAFSLGSSLVAQEKMTMEEYEAQLAEWQKREADAKGAIAQCEDEKAGLKDQIASTEDQIKGVWDEIYALVDSDEAGVNAYRDQLNAIESEVDGLGALAPEDLFRQRKAIDALEERLNGMKENKIYALTEMQNHVARIEGKVARLRERMPKSVYDEYTVMRGDYLWRIAGKDDIYDDPFQWVRIYSYNRDMIKDPNMIYPEQTLKIQRGVGPDEYLVEKGDFLHKIAGKEDVMGDPAAWTKLYEANKDIIGDDPSMIYPYQVLRKPQN